MAWNPSPDVADLRELSRKWKHDIIVVLAVDSESGVFKTVSYGQTRELCNLAKDINDYIHDEVANGRIEIDI